MTPAERNRKAAAQLRASAGRGSVRTFEKIGRTENAHTCFASREHSLKTAFIVISEKTLKIECTVIDTSPAGVILRVPTTFGIPQDFDVVIAGKCGRCRLQWKTDTKIAARFSNPA